MRKKGHEDAQAELLDLQARKRGAMEAARTRLQPAGEQVRILTHVLNGKKKELRLAEERLTTARSSVEILEDAVRLVR